MGEIHPKVSSNYDISIRCCAAEIDVDMLFILRGHVQQYVELPRFPAITRDLSLVCDKGMFSSEIEKVLKSTGGEILESIDVFDVYTGENLGDGKKSIAYSLTLRDREKTLTDGEADRIISEMLTSLSPLGVFLRGVNL
jgi:phenylalanyl-tRNA synthetase beta chain